MTGCISSRGSRSKGMVRYSLAILSILTVACGSTLPREPSTLPSVHESSLDDGIWTFEDCPLLDPCAHIVVAIHENVAEIVRTPPVGEREVWQNAARTQPDGSVAIILGIVEHSEINLATLTRTNGTVWLHAGPQLTTYRHTDLSTTP